MRSATGHSLAFFIIFGILICLALGLTAVFFFKSASTGVSASHGFLTGRNNNPRFKEFMYSFRETLVHKQLHESSASSGNAIPLDKINILEVRSKSSCPMTEINWSSSRHRMIDDDKLEYEQPDYDDGISGFITNKPGENLNEVSDYIGIEDTTISLVTRDIVEYISGSRTPKSATKITEREYVATTAPTDKNVELVRPVKIWYLLSQQSPPLTPEQLKNHPTDHYRAMHAQIWDPHPRYEFTGFGRNFRLDLTLSDPVVAPGIKVTQVWKNMSISEEPNVNTHGCFYNGQVHGDPYSKVSVSLCHGMRGHIWTSSGSYTIEPAEKWRGKSEAMLHLLTKMAPMNHDSCIYEDDENPRVINHMDDMEFHGDESLRSRRTKRSYGQEYTIELLVVADKKMQDFHGAELHHYIVNLVAGVDKIYKDSSIGNPMRVVLVDILIPNDIQDLSGYNASEILLWFCDFQYRMKRHHDAAIFLTREKLCRTVDVCNSIGLAEVGGICRNNSALSCAIVKDMGLSTAFTIAHELGHILSLPHDNTSRGALCHRFAGEIGTRKHLMASFLETDSTPWKWSPCSKALLTEFLEDGHGYCLLDDPVRDLGEKKHEKQLLGEVFSLDKQCEYAHGKGYVHCERRNDVCFKLWCRRNSSEVCSTHHIPWADGTMCGAGMWCKNKLCISKEALKPINGGWSKWKRSGDCSRTCGGGVSISYRECNNPVPMNGGKYCLGERVRYHSCNVQECPPGSMDFRKEQCAVFDNQTFNASEVSPYVKWIPKYDGISMAERCKLYCRDSGNYYYYKLKEKVIDGTPCGPYTFDICVNGICRAAGCDHVLNSKKKLDNCGKCGGDNSTCKVITGTYNKTQYGYNSVISIPTGATNLDIKQHGYLNSNKDNNFLALYDNTTSQYILNGNYQVSGRKIILYDTTTLEYSGSDSVVERITSTRPLTKDLNLQVCSTGILYPPDITYEYTIPNDSLYQYQWGLTDEWTPCDKVCNGESWQMFKCVRDDWVEFSSELCAATPRGEPLRKSCNTHCTLSWQAVGKRECSSDCGPGYRIIDFECTVEEEGNKKAAPESACGHIPRPEDSEPCEGQCIEPKWVFSIWGECSKSCGTGYRERKAYCMDSYKQRRNDSECIQSEKKTKEACNTQDCPTWQVGEWTQCSVTCGGGKRHRAFWCQYDGREDRNERCPLPSPVITETCNIEPCAYWIEGEWAECSATCGQGEETRHVYCSVPNACSNYDKPVTSRPCYMPECSLGHANAIPGYSNSRYSWRQSWSECSVTCGQGVTYSNIVCYDNHAEKITDFRNCAGQVRPSHRSGEICYMAPCTRWVVGDWEPCSAICGSGTQSRRITCESLTGDIMPDEACSMHEKPPREEKRCNIVCPQRSDGLNEWIKKPWSPCSVSCGRGVMVRSVKCYGHCMGPTPPMSSPCDAGPCPDEGKWQVSAWTQCNVTCGDGAQERQIWCESQTGELLADNYCSGPIPSRRQICRGPPCKPVYKWVVSKWTQCSASCGRGTRRRTVECMSSRGEQVSAHHCAIMRKRPNDLKGCKRVPCLYDWEEGEWSQCSSTCGNGVQSRKVRCVKNIMQGKIRKERYEVGRHFCHSIPRPDTSKTCRGYCNNEYKWETGVWHPCNKPCSSKGKQKRNLYCYYGKKKVPLRMCPKELRPIRRKKCDTVMCPSCRALKEGYNINNDGVYNLWLGGRNVPIYCYGMPGTNPKEYLTLRNVTHDNFAEIFSNSIRRASQCMSWGHMSDHCESDGPEVSYGYTVFSKIRINVTSFMVDSTDWTFAVTKYGSPVGFGEAGDCHTRGLCPEGNFNINLHLTGFRIASTTTWVGLGTQPAPPDIRISQDRTNVMGRCGGCCGFCKPRNGLKLDLLPP